MEDKIQKIVKRILYEKSNLEWNKNVYENDIKEYTEKISEIKNQIFFLNVALDNYRGAIKETEKKLKNTNNELEFIESITYGILDV